MLSCILVTYLFVSRINGFAIKILNLSNNNATIKNKALISIIWHGFCRGGTSLKALYTSYTEALNLVINKLQGRMMQAN